MKKILQQVLDVISIAFPAIIAILGIFDLTNVISIAETVEQVILILLGAATSIASIWSNRLKHATDTSTVT